MGQRRPRNPNNPNRSIMQPRIIADIQLPIGKHRGSLKSYKSAGGNEPGKIFKDVQGKYHVVPRKTKLSKLMEIAKRKKA